MKHHAKRLITITLALTLILSLFSVLSVSAAENKVRVVVKNENFSAADGAVWDGTLIDKWVSLNNDDSMESVLERTVGDNGFEFTVSDYGYISSVNGLSEFANNGNGGWMVSLNDWFPLESSSYYTVEKGLLSDGDEIVMMYTNNWGSDCGSIYGDLSTTLKSLSVEGATIEEEFSPSNTEYTLIISSAVNEVKVFPEAYNKNYQVRTYKNELQAETDGADIKRGRPIEVSDGDKIIIGVGYPCWPSMNSFAGESVGTDYTLNVKYVPIKGDLNENGKLDIEDVTIIQRHVAEFSFISEKQTAIADYNGDDKIDINDATAIQRVVAEFTV